MLIIVRMIVDDNLRYERSYRKCHADFFLEKGNVDLYRSNVERGCRVFVKYLLLRNRLVRCLFNWKKPHHGLSSLENISLEEDLGFTRNVIK